MSHDDNDTKIEQTRGLRATTTMSFDDFKDSTPTNSEFEEHEETLQMATEMAERVAEVSGGDIGSTINSPSLTTKRGHPILKLLVIVVILAIAGGAAVFYTQGKDALLKYVPESLKTTVASFINNKDNQDSTPQSPSTSEQDTTELAMNDSFSGGDLDSEIVQTAPETSTVVDDFNPTEVIEKTVEDNSSDDVNLEMLEQQMKLLEEGDIDNIDESIEELSKAPQETESADATDGDTETTSIIDATDGELTAETKEPETAVDDFDFTKSLDVAEDDIVDGDTQEEETPDVAIDGSLDDEDLVIAEPVVKEEAKPLPMPKKQYQLTATDKKIKNFIELYKVGSNKANTLASLIGEAASENNLEAVLVAAIIAAESSYDAEVVSDSGKIGLMQLSNADAKNIVALSKGELTKGDLKDPAYNLQVGLWYIKFLQYYYKGDLQATLAAYEMGQKEYEKIHRAGKALPTSTKRFDHNVHNVYKLISKQNPSNADRAFKKSAASPKKEQQETVKPVAKPVAKPVQEVKQQVAATPVKSIPMLRKIIGFSTKDEATIDNLEKLVIQRSAEKSLDPIFVASVVMAESSFKPDSISESGKVGLMQIDPDRAKLMAKETGKDWLGTKELLNPDYNLELGVAYLSYCTVAFPKDFKAAILCFNAGEDIAKNQAEAPAYTASYLKNLKTYFRLWGATLPKGMKF